MELQEALSQISEIRRQMARSEVFRGYRAVPVAGTGVLAVAAAAVQGAWIEAPTERIGAYLALWVGAAALGLACAVGEMAGRARRVSARWGGRVAFLALEQFAPCTLAGALVTGVLVRTAPEAVWMLPGLWQVFFALGIFASFRLLPRATFWVATFYLLTGLACLAGARGDWELWPWAMGLPFGLGQAMAAAILYWALERDDVRTDRQR